MKRADTRPEIKPVEKTVEQDDGSQEMILAAARGEEERVAFLIAHGANVNARDRWQRTALLAAVEADAAGSGPVIARLLEADANVNARDKKKRSALDFAIASGNLEIIRLLVEHDAEVKDAALARLKTEHSEVFDLITEFRARKALEPVQKVRKRPVRNPKPAVPSTPTKPARM